MKDDLSGLAEEPKKPALLHADKNPTHHADTCPPNRDCNDIGREGASLFKKDGKYYLTAADTYEGRYSSLAAISDNIYGPYDRRTRPCPAARHRLFPRQGWQLVVRLFRQRQPGRIPRESRRSCGSSSTPTD